MQAPSQWGAGEGGAAGGGTVDWHSPLRAVQRLEDSGDL